jgi:O-antigen ligase
VSLGKKSSTNFTFGDKSCVLNRTLADVPMMTLFRLVESHRFFIFLVAASAVSLFLKSGVTAVLCFVFLFYSLFIKRKQKWDFKTWPLIIPIVLFLVYALWAFFSDDRTLALRDILKRHPLLLIPLSFALLKNEMDKNDVLLILRIFVFACLGVTLLCYGNAIWNIIEHQTIYSPDIDRKSYYFSYYALVKPIGIDPIYMSMIYNFAVFISLTVSVTKARWINVLISVYLGIFIIMVAAKIGIIILVALLLLFSWQRAQKKLAGVFMMALIVATSIIAINTVPILKERFIISTSFDFAEPNGGVWNSITLRLAIWSCALDVIKDKPMIGHGTGSGLDAIEKGYERNNFVWGLIHREIPTVTRYNAHNEFLFTQIELGLVGQFVLLFMVIGSFIFFARNRDSLGVTFMLIMTLCFMIEVVFFRQKGIYFFAFWFSFLIFTSDLRREHTAQEFLPSDQANIPAGS